MKNDIKFHLDELREEYMKKIEEIRAKSPKYIIIDFHDNDFGHLALAVAYYIFFNVRVDTTSKEDILNTFIETLSFLVLQKHKLENYNLECTYESYIDYFKKSEIFIILDKEIPDLPNLEVPNGEVIIIDYVNDKCYIK